MNKRLTTILLLIVLCFTACNRRQSATATTSELTAREYDVLSAYLAGKFAGQPDKELVSKGIVKIVIFNMTSFGDDDLLGNENGRPIPWEETAEFLRKRAPALQKATLEGFRKVNSEQAILRHSFHSRLPYEFVDSTRPNSIFSKNCGWWPAYYKQFPGSQGILTFSRVGFSTDGTQALFYVSNSCGGLCGIGGYAVMEKHNGLWMMREEIEMWVS